MRIPRVIRYVLKGLRARHKRVNERARLPRIEYGAASKVSRFEKKMPRYFVDL